ncbi:MAG: hypothetical protein EHM70_25550 [Chloroflexota bacterium]|nr:MAG: hypothetical protein EHM70_25550 [Chloroflexota bacterium]
MTELPESFSQDLMDYLKVIADQGVRNAAKGFAKMLGQKLEVTQPEIRLVPFQEIPNMLGGPEQEGVGIYLRVEGDIPGQMILVLPYDKAVDLAALMLEVHPSSIHGLGSLERSALGEMGNMTGTFFLNSLAELTGLSVRPSPPAVMVDMIGAILDIIVATTGGFGLNVMLFQATFVYGERRTQTEFWVFPDPNTLKSFAERAKLKDV